MGRLPMTFGKEQIRFRIPYELTAEVDIAPSTSGQVMQPESLTHAIDKPFEIHRMIIRLVAKGVTDIGQPEIVLEQQPQTLKERIRMQIADYAKNENLLKGPGRVSTLLSALTESWEFEEPYTLVRAEGFQIQLSSDAYPSVCVPGARCDTFALVEVSNVRVEVGFQGYLIVVSPPTSER